jgi:hypothetical protein
VIFRTTSDTGASQPLGLQERVEELAEREDGEREAEDGLERHGRPQSSSQRFWYQSVAAKRARVTRRKRASSMEVS